MTLEEHGHAWPNTPLGEYFTHYKGPKGKERAIAHQPDETEAIDLQRLGNDPAITSRYQQITRILSVLPHESIVEVGVAKGERAVAMCSINLERGKKVKYTGFDFFEDITPEISALEHNGKGVDAQDKVAEKLDALKIRFPGLFEWQLVKGNTRETLPKHPVEDVDVAFISMIRASIRD